MAHLLHIVGQQREVQAAIHPVPRGQQQHGQCRLANVLGQLQQAAAAVTEASMSASASKGSTWSGNQGCLMHPAHNTPRK